MVTLTNDIQLLKAAFPIEVIESGMTTLARELQAEKAESPIAVTGQI